MTKNHNITDKTAGYFEDVAIRSDSASRFMEHGQIGVATKADGNNSA